MPIVPGGFDWVDGPGPTPLNAVELNAEQTALKQYTDTQTALVAPVTKRVTSSLAPTCTASSNLTGFPELCHRFLLTLPVSTTRWRVRQRNYNASAPAAYGALIVAGVSVGSPLLTSDPWNGVFASAPSAALAGYTTPADGSEYTSAWVTNPALQFQKGVVLGITQAFAAASPFTVASASGASVYWLGATSSGVVTNGLGASAPAGGESARYGATFTDLRIEYEFVTATGALGMSVVAVVGDSITAGYCDTGAGNISAQGAFPHQAWPGAAGLRRGFCTVNLGHGGSLMGNFASLSDWRWARADLATTPPDVFVIASGSNDAAASVTAAQTQSDLLTVIANCLTINPVARIYLATVIPRAFTLPTYEVDSVALTGGATGGNGTLGFTWLGNTYTTAPLTVGMTAAQVAAAVQAVLPATATGGPAVTNPVGTGGPLGTSPITLTFARGLYGPVTAQAANSSFTGGTPVFTFTRTTSGVTTSEALRVALNQLERSVPFGVTGCFDFDKALALSSNPTVSDPDFTSIDVHPNRAGYQRMAQVVAL